MRCILVRHPQLAIPSGLCYGRRDWPWSIAGLRRADEIVYTLADASLGQVLTGPAPRCLRLAQMLVPSPVIEPRLHELDFGDWEGRPWDAIPRAEIDWWAGDPAVRAPPGGESGNALLARVRAVADDLRAAGRDTIIVLHGGPMKVLPALLSGAPPDLLAPAPPPGSILELQVNAISTAVSATEAAAPSTSPV